MSSFTRLRKKLAAKMDITSTKIGAKVYRPIQHEHSTRSWQVTQYFRCDSWQADGDSFNLHLCMDERVYTLCLCREEAMELIKSLTSAIDDTEESHKRSLASENEEKEKTV
jgi:hypothetical protein